MWVNRSMSCGKRCSECPRFASFLNAGVITSPPKTSETPNPVSSSSTMRIFGASTGNRRGSVGHFIVESCSNGLTTLSIGVGGNGSTEPSFNGDCAAAESSMRQQLNTKVMGGKRLVICCFRLGTMG